MTKLYKLTDKNGQTYGGMQWGEDVTHCAPGNGELCSATYIHAYTHPLLAVLLNPIHAKFSDPILWESDGVVEKEDKGLKVGCTRLTTMKKIEIPNITTTQNIAFAILCAKAVCSSFEWNKWADDWLDGIDRTEFAADVAAKATWAVVQSLPRIGGPQAEAAKWAAIAAKWAAQDRLSIMEHWTAATAVEALFAKVVDLGKLAEYAVANY